MKTTLKAIENFNFFQKLFWKELDKDNEEDDREEDYSPQNPLGGSLEPYDIKGDR